MSSRRQRSILLGGRYRQVSLYTKGPDNWSINVRFVYRFLTHCGRDKLDAIWQTTIWNAFFLSIKIYKFWFRFHRILFPRGQLTSHYLRQRWFIYWRIYAPFGLNELTQHSVISRTHDSKYISKTSLFGPCTVLSYCYWTFSNKKLQANMLFFLKCLEAGKWHSNNGKQLFKPRCFITPGTYNKVSHAYKFSFVVHGAPGSPGNQDWSELWWRKTRSLS